MNAPIAGLYFDGRDGRAHVVELRRVGAAHYALDGESVRRGGALAELSPAPRLARLERAVGFADGARLLLPAEAAIDAWFPRRNRLEALVDRLERHAHAIAAALVVCVAAFGFGAFWGVPRAADRIAAAMPVQAERALGAHVLDSLDRLGGLSPSRLDAARRDELAQRFAALLRDDGDRGDGYELAFRDAPDIGANAFALPGGTIVVTDQLVPALDDDREFDAIVAHEIGHERHRHALRQALRGSAVAVAAVLVAGDVSSAGAVVVAVPTFLLDSHYSRGFEAEADAFAFELLARHGESPRWFARAMRNLESAHDDDAMPDYLRSHPPTADRIARAGTAAARFAQAHPELCPDGVCPGDAADDECDDCDCDGCDADDGNGAAPSPAPDEGDARGPRDAAPGDGLRRAPDARQPTAAVSSGTSANRSPTRP